MIRLGIGLGILGAVAAVGVGVTLLAFRSVNPRFSTDYLEREWWYHTRG